MIDRDEEFNRGALPKKRGTWDHRGSVLMVKKAIDSDWGGEAHVLDFWVILNIDY